VDVALDEIEGLTRATTGGLEQKVLLESDPARARSVARQGCAFYLGLANYQARLRRLGYDEADLANGGGDRLIDDLVAWGSAAEIAARLQEQFDAGASHVCINPIDPTGGDRPSGLTPPPRAEALDAFAVGWSRATWRSPRR
jgi:alkanesulfonate monooxygenase SsuD/methylene tetrahydromethanopterin reductase-like flavin-dependent oxidoreductase (luciferase family)